MNDDEYIELFHIIFEGTEVFTSICQIILLFRFFNNIIQLQQK